MSFVSPNQQCWSTEEKIASHGFKNTNVGTVAITSFLCNFLLLRNVLFYEKKTDVYCYYCLLTVLHNFAGRVQKRKFAPIVRFLLFGNAVLLVSVQNITPLISVHFVAF